ncbi:MAG: hypothetical protein K6C36_08690 [Clostridia bacterium]|nr:hypothetical protein [Clostridia bacterium]
MGDLFSNISFDTSSLTEIIEGLKKFILAILYIIRAHRDVNNINPYYLY